MAKKVLFEITEEDLETGLRGVPVGYCPTSRVDPQKGLFYLDYPIAKLATWEPEKVIYLLYHGREGKGEKLETFTQELRKRGTCSEKVLSHISQLPKQGHPMALFSAAILICGMLECQGDYREDCLNLIAKIPTLTAAVIRHHAQWGMDFSSEPERGYMENFVHMLNLPVTKELIHVFKLFNVLHYDHGGGNLSTFVGKAVASGLEDIYGAIAAAMNALAGLRHGRANQEALSFVKDMVHVLGEKATPLQVEGYIRKKLENKELIYGFGHAVLRVEDPRATILYDFAKTHYFHNPLVKMALLLRQEGIKVLQENPKITNPYPNVDAVSGTLLTAAGLSSPEYFTLLFGMARSVGIAIQIVYERCMARQGRGTPIIRPKYLYKPLYEKISSTS